MTFVGGQRELLAASDLLCDVAASGVLSAEAPFDAALCGAALLQLAGALFFPLLGFFTALFGLDEGCGELAEFSVVLAEFCVCFVGAAC